EGVVVKFRIKRADIEVSMTNTGNAVYKTDYALSVEIKANLKAGETDVTSLFGSQDVSYSVTNGIDENGRGKASVSGAVLSPLHTGEVNVAANIAQTRNYNAATSAAVKVTIEQAEMSDFKIDLSSESFVYGNSVNVTSGVSGNGDGENEDGCTDQDGWGTLSFAVTGGADGTSGDATIDAVTGLLTPTHIGKVKITVTAAETHNFKQGECETVIEIKPRPVELEWGVKQNDGTTQWDNSLTYSTVYDGQRHNPEVRAINTVGGEEVTVTLAAGAIDAGKHTAKPESLSNENYTLDGVTENAEKEYEITQLKATFNWDSVKKFVYNGQVQYPKAFVTNLVNREDTSKEDVCDVIVLGTKDAGANLVAMITGLSNPNYSLEGYTDQDLSTTYEIVPKTAELVWSNTTTLVYNGTDQAPTASVGNLESGDQCDVTVVGKQINAGGFDEAEDGTLTINNTYVATAFALSNPNYTLNTYDSELNLITDASGNPVLTEDTTEGFLIQRAPITVDLVTKSTVYGTDLTLSVTGNEGKGAVKYTV
ncbi:MAG: hypothetical protein K2H43_06270, partial [Clostridia bacterium]|nr:hypothetical protein [Clostridia bacterium]